MLYYNFDGTMKDFILTSNRSVYNPLSRVNNKSLQMSSLDIKIALLFYQSSGACLFFCFLFFFLSLQFCVHFECFCIPITSSCDLGSAVFFQWRTKAIRKQNLFFNSPEQDSLLHIKLNWKGWRQPTSYTVIVPGAQAVHITLESAML